MMESNRSRGSAATTITIVAVVVLILAFISINLLEQEEQGTASDSQSFERWGNQAGESGHSSGSLACDPSKKARIQLSMDNNGSNPPRVFVDAFCGGNQVQSLHADDDGSGRPKIHNSPNGAQVAGIGTCKAWQNAGGSAAYS